MLIFSHRGIESGRVPILKESSIEAFKDHLQRGFSIEFDLAVTKDRKFVVLHDSNLTRVTGASDNRPVQDVDLDELRGIFERIDTPLATFDELFALISTSSAPLHALHFKGALQQDENVHMLCEYLTRYRSLQSKLLIFDLKPMAARIFRMRSLSCLLGASVAHRYDVLRFNGATHGTLLNIEGFDESVDLYEYVWLDEWDLRDERGMVKTFYTQENFTYFRSRGKKIALVTPELHSSSPGLLGGEFHADATTRERLFDRIAQIIQLKPDVICTDFPSEVRDLTLSMLP